MKPLLAALFLIACAHAVPAPASLRDTWLADCAAAGGTPENGDCKLKPQRPVLLGMPGESHEHFLARIITDACSHAESDKITDAAEIALHDCNARGDLHCVFQVCQSVHGFTHSCDDRSLTKADKP